MVSNADDNADKRTWLAAEYGKLRPYEQHKPEAARMSEGLGTRLDSTA